MRRLRTWWVGAGVQVRSTVAATAVQAVVVLAAGLVLLLTLQHNLQTTVDASTSATAQGLASLLDPLETTGAAGGAARPELSSGTVPADLRDAVDAAARRRAVVQVVDADGEVVVSSSDLADSRALTTVAPAAGSSRTFQRSLPFDDDPYRFTALGVQAGSSHSTVLVGESLGTGDSTLHAALVGLAVAGPLLLLTVAGATYLFVGHSLRPVTDIRTTVEGITHRDLSERVPVPPGNDEVAQLARTMNVLLGDLSRSSATQRQFVSDASHELRSPVATLLAAADIALTQPGHQDPLDLPRLVRGEARRLDRLVADLLLLARLDERSTQGDRDGAQYASPPAPGAGGGGVVAGSTDEVDLDDLLTEEARRLRTSTSLTVHVHREPVRVRGQHHELSRAVRNLADNAARHARSTVSLRLFRDGDGAVVEVANDGDPIPAGEADRIFERFVRLEESRARDLGGSGLGLAIVREVVRAHGGTVDVAQLPGEVCFRIELPTA